MTCASCLSISSNTHATPRHQQAHSHTIEKKEPNCTLLVRPSRMSMKERTHTQQLPRSTEQHTDQCQSTSRRERFVRERWICMPATWTSRVPTATCLSDCTFLLLVWVLHFSVHNHKKTNKLSLRTHTHHQNDNRLCRVGVGSRWEDTVSFINHALPDALSSLHVGVNEG